MEVTLFVGYPKQDKLEQVIRHGVELGCTHFDECGLGKQALYLGAFGISRMRYIPLPARQLFSLHSDRCRAIIPSSKSASVEKAVNFPGR